VSDPTNSVKALIALNLTSWAQLTMLQQYNVYEQEIQIDAN